LCRLIFFGGVVLSVFLRLSGRKQRARSGFPASEPGKKRDFFDAPEVLLRGFKFCYISQVKWLVSHLCGGSMKKLLYAVVVVALAGQAFAADWKPSDALMKAVRQVESNNGKILYGDSGKSLGAFQMSEAAWLDVSAWRRARGQKVYSYENHALHTYINQVYASDYLSMIHGELSRKLKRAPTAGEIYAAYNMGLGNFAGCGYRLAKVNPVTARKARQIHAILAGAG
jgi:hypothetical protein